MPITFSRTHCAAAAAAAVTCGATTSFPVASTVVHRRPAARMSYRGRSAAPQRPSGTFTFERRARARRRDRVPAHSRSRVERPRASAVHRHERRTPREKLRPRANQPSAPADARRHTDVATGDARSPPTAALPTTGCCAPHQAARTSLRRSALPRAQAPCALSPSLPSETVLYA